MNMRKSKVNLKSIGFKLITGGCLAVAIPLIIVGAVSVQIASRDLIHISAENAASQATKLAATIEATLDAQTHTAAAHATDMNVRLVGEKVKESGVEGAQSEIAQLRQIMKEKFKLLDKDYLGIFVTDSVGYGYTGELANGQEYKGVNVSDLGFFKQAKSGKAAIGDIIKSQVTGDRIYVVSAPILSRSGEFLGIFGLSLKADTLTTIVSSVKFGQTGYGVMIDQNGIAVAHPKKDLEMSLDLKTIPGMAKIASAMEAGKQGSDRYTFNGVPKIAGYAPVPLKGWSVVLTQDEEEFLASSRSIRNSIVVTAIVSIFIVFVVVFFASKSIIRPLNHVVSGLRDIAQGEGDLTRRLAVKSQDEVGEISTWFNTFIEKLHGIISDVGNNIGTLNKSAEELSTLSDTMSAGSDDASNRAATVAAAAEQMSNNMNAVAAASEQAATNVSMVAAAAEEMSATVNEIAGNASKARQITEQAVEKTTVASDRMNELGGAANEISKVTEAITEISEQTNLLALNATIEAARAGEAGKGFAVVANEIKELAKQTSTATLEIRRKIEAIQSASSLSVREMNEIKTVINDINEIVTTIATAVEEQSVSTKEIATNVSQAAQGIAEVNENVSQSSTVSQDIAQEIGGVSHIAGALSQDSVRVNNQANELLTLAEQLSAIVNKFKLK